MAKVLICLASGLLGLSVCSGQSTRVVPLQQLVERADLVLVGELISGTFPSTGGAAHLTLRADRVLKSGGVGDGTAVNATWILPTPRRVPPYTTIGKLSKEYGLWFLVRSPERTWTLVPRVEGFVPIESAHFRVQAGPLLAAYSYSDDAPVLDKAILELAAAAEASDAGYRQFGPEFFVAVRGLDSDTLASAFELLARSKSANLRTFALAGMIERGSVPALAQFERELDSLSTASHIQAVVGAIEMFFRNPAAEAVATLGRLATKETAVHYLQNGALYALRTMHTKESLPYFVQLLDSPDIKMRYDAVAGLASFANEGRVLPEKMEERNQPLPATRRPFTTDETLANFPGLEEFKNDDQRYTVFWKNWWIQNKNAVHSQ